MMSWWPAAGDDASMMDTAVFTKSICFGSCYLLVAMCNNKSGRPSPEEKTSLSAAAARTAIFSCLLEMTMSKSTRAIETHELDNARLKKENCFIGLDIGIVSTFLFHCRPVRLVVVTWQ